MDVDVTSCGNGLAFDHVHMYADALQDVTAYKQMETRFNDFDTRFAATAGTVK